MFCINKIGVVSAILSLCFSSSVSAAVLWDKAPSGDASAGFYADSNNGAWVETVNWGYSATVSEIGWWGFYNPMGGDSFSLEIDGTVVSLDTLSKTFVGKIASDIDSVDLYKYELTGLGLNLLGGGNRTISIVNNDPTSGWAWQGNADNNFRALYIAGEQVPVNQTPISATLVLLSLGGLAMRVVGRRSGRMQNHGI